MKRNVSNTCRSTAFKFPQTTAEIIAITRAGQPRGENTLRSFGTALGVSKQQIAWYENNAQEPSNERLHEWFHSDIDWISTMATEIMVVRYRSMLKLARHTD
jgi:transcriptional regulator with XRE-family HTH domain